MVLGNHDGIDRFTIGQRKGLGVAAGAKRFVLDIVPETNDVIVGDPDQLLTNGLVASQINWLIDVPQTIQCEAKIRYRHNACPAFVETTRDGEAVVRFDDPQTAVTPGQAVAFYDGTRVLGGGWIEKRI